MGIILKSRGELDRIREAGRVVAEILDKLEAIVAPGVSTAELNRVAIETIRARGGTAPFMTDAGFPAPICTSINEEVVHGVPGPRKLAEGDIVSVDVGVRLGGFIGDSARTFMVGQVDDETRRLVEVTRRCLELAVAAARPGSDLVEIARAVQEHAEASGFSVVREFVGHGVGASLHEPPQVPNFVGPGGASPGTTLSPGTVLAIEPMVNAGTHKVRKLSDGWCIVTRDGRRSAHFEHTVAVTEDGPVVMTAP